MIVLHGFTRSSASFRVRVALNIKRIPYKTRSYDLTKGENKALEYTSINPQALLPAIEHDGRIITQSLAIIEYLDEVFPNSPLLPSQIADRAWVRSIAQMIASDTHAFTSMRAGIFLRANMKQRDTDVTGWQYHWLDHTFSALEERLKKRREDWPFCHGVTPTVADITLVPQVFAAQKLLFPITAYPTISGIFAICMNLEEFKNAAPEAKTAKVFQTESEESNASH